MKRLKLLILIFCIAIVIPMTFVVLRTYQGLAQEEASALRFFAETLFDNMESELAVLISKEENRAVDEYNYTYTPSSESQDSRQLIRSPLSYPPEAPYIIGYLQNNPDGSFQTPLVDNEQQVSSQLESVFQQLGAINTIFNDKKFAPREPRAPKPILKTQVADTESKGTFADKYLKVRQPEEGRNYIGKKEKRVEEITISQARNITKQSSLPSARAKKIGGAQMGAAEEQMSEDFAAAPSNERDSLAASSYAAPEMEMEALPGLDDRSPRFQVEVAPFQSVFIDNGHIFIFRRIIIDHQVYRQGFALNIGILLNHLADQYFSDQPMARFAGLNLKIYDRGKETDVVNTGVQLSNARLNVHRNFPPPFDFISANLSCDNPPEATGRKTLNIALIFLAVVMLVGLASLYQSVRSIMELSERRSQFVSSVTHELKTPLTNIRMYIEMLEMGIAGNRDREQEYFEILGSESARLSRLITNVLELSKLEKKQRYFNFQQGDFSDVMQEVESVMRPKLKAEGFTLEIDNSEAPSFSYDKEVMVQILINLMENSIKFGRRSDRKTLTLRLRKHGDRVRISVSDTGPGIPRKSLKRVFDDFYRVENDLTRTTAGTGIGLALVKKFVTAMGGEVAAANNTGPGCTITLTLPGDPEPSARR